MERMNFLLFRIFTTVPIKIGDVEISEVSRTSANIDSKIDLGDAEAMLNVVLGKKKKYHLCSKLEKTLIDKKLFKGFYIN